MLVTKLIVTLLSAVSGAMAVVVPMVAPVDNPPEVEKRETQWDKDSTKEWRVACPSPRIWQWRGNLVNWQWCQDHCACRTKFVKVWGICKYEEFLECYHNYCECYHRIGHVPP
ncbi:hypothetical protein TWF192_007829 [Orbilia oligospora]|uniref:Invertebrate defensins family profile domain-containing protein n=1 Tax=Orbilia oligospora TaxID=2813651 RepID=A0A6G1M371_ORBOL|nr:hypothetical protein TWF679_003468 [Orbilia oligospora]KAF3202181.1 hypothetical protein TWF191_003144 [Orbilia oligospora]KAF3244024.1 hypothetical protein TWF192_007829 [Orbilia oligospora]